MAYVERLVTEDSFDAMGKFVKAGHVGSFDEERLNGEEKHLATLSGGPLPAVQIAPITVTGPNPTVPQQIPPDAVQDASGQYAIPGKRLVAEVTAPADQRLSEDMDPAAEAQRSEELNDILGDGDADRGLVGTAGGPGSTSGNADDALVEGTVAEVTANLGAKSDDELKALEAAEKDREKPRAGVLKAIEAERESRAANQQ